MHMDQSGQGTAVARRPVTGLARPASPVLPASPVARMALLVVAVLILRIGLAATIPLSIDESYAVVVSRSHSLSYFDHPPLGFALARLMADITGCECRLLVRLPYVVLG